MIDKSKIRIGNIVWFKEYWTERVVYGKVESIEDWGVKVHGVSRDDDNSFTGSLDCQFKNIYRSKDECIEAVNTENEKIVEEYKAEITDLESLIAFPLKHNVGQCEEYTDYNAIKAYTEKAAELILPLKSKQHEIDR